MSPNFQIHALPHETFRPLHSHTSEELEAHCGRWVTVDAAPGYPCRVTLEDAEVGERVLLLTYTHHDTDSPYRSSGPIFVRPGREALELAPGALPPVLAGRTLSLRAYDRDGILIDAAIAPGPEASAAVEALFEKRGEATSVQIHNAATGCFFCEAKRV